jgi:hypothetical protein
LGEELGGAWGIPPDATPESSCAGVLGLSQFALGPNRSINFYTFAVHKTKPHTHLLTPMGYFGCNVENGYGPVHYIPLTQLSGINLPSGDYFKEFNTGIKVDFSSTVSEVKASVQKVENVIKNNLTGNLDLLVNNDISFDGFAKPSLGISWGWDLSDYSNGRPPTTGILASMGYNLNTAKISNPIHLNHLPYNLMTKDSLRNDLALSKHSARTPEIIYPINKPPELEGYISAHYSSCGPTLKPNNPSISSFATKNIFLMRDTYSGRELDASYLKALDNFLKLKVSGAFTNGQLGHDILSGLME